MKDANGKETKLPARMDAYKGQEAEAPLPPLTARHLYDHLMEVGPVEAGAMGPVPISWSTIRNWAEQTFKRLGAWESCLLRRLSTEYLAELHAAEDYTRGAPWAPSRGEVDREGEERQLRAVLG